MTRWALLSTTSWWGRRRYVTQACPIEICPSSPATALAPAHLQLGKVGSPIRQQLHRAALQTQGLLPLCSAQLTLPTLILHLSHTIAPSPSKPKHPHPAQDLTCDNMTPWPLQAPLSVQYSADTQEPCGADQHLPTQPPLPPPMPADLHSHHQSLTNATSSFRPTKPPTSHLLLPLPIFLNPQEPQKSPSYTYTKPADTC